MSTSFHLCPLLCLLYLPLSLAKGREGDTSRTNWRFFSRRSHFRLGEICRRRRCLGEGVGRYKKARRAAAGYLSVPVITPPSSPSEMKWSARVPLFTVLITLAVYCKYRPTQFHSLIKTRNRSSVELLVRLQPFVWIRYSSGEIVRLVFRLQKKIVRITCAADYRADCNLLFQQNSLLYTKGSIYLYKWVKDWATHWLLHWHFLTSAPLNIILEWNQLISNLQNNYQILTLNISRYLK